MDSEGKFITIACKMNLRCLFRVLCLFTLSNLGKDFEEHSHDMPSCQVVAAFPIWNLRKNAYVCQWVGLFRFRKRTFAQFLV